VTKRATVLSGQKNSPHPNNRSSARSQTPTHTHTHTRRQNEKQQIKKSTHTTKKHNHTPIVTLEGRGETGSNILSSPDARAMGDCFFLNNIPPAGFSFAGVNHHSYYALAKTDDVPRHRPPSFTPCGQGHPRRLHWIGLPPWADRSCRDHRQDDHCRY